MATDPVCGMTVDEKTAAATASYQGQPYYFCARRRSTRRPPRTRRRVADNRLRCEVPERPQHTQGRSEP
jgi:hypothetical protein